jgi:hypothetical protein
MNNNEDMELSVVGLILLVLEVNFLSVIFEQQKINLAVCNRHALPIVALSWRINSIKGQRSALKKKIIVLPLH